MLTKTTCKNSTYPLRIKFTCSQLENNTVRKGAKRPVCAGTPNDNRH